MGWVDRGSVKNWLEPGKIVVIPGSADFETPHLKITVYYPIEIGINKCFMSCDELGMPTRSLMAKNLEEAKEEAMDIVIDRLADMIKELAKSR